MKTPLDDIFIDQLLATAFNEDGCELLLESEMPPRFRRHGENTLVTLRYQAPRAAVVHRLIYDILSDEQIRDLENDESLLFVYEAEDVARFGVFATHEKSQIAATFHLMPK